ncbi:hypothetical protein ACQKE0_01635 [Shewanella colwelliana]|uniref:hypothetical protein n=1 Tax=Shewanella colwelliana TaxID=23 RepID=UPI003CFE01CC
MFISLDAINFEMNGFIVMRLEDYLKNGALLVTLITAYFYCSSMVYNIAYLTRLGLDSDVLERSFNAVVYQGFIFNLKWMVYLFTLSFLFIGLRALSIINFRRYIRKDKNNARKVIRSIRFMYGALNLGHKDSDYFERTLIKRSIQACTFLSVIYCMFFSIAHFQKEGSRVADIVNVQIEKQKEIIAGRKGVTLVNQDLEYLAIIPNKLDFTGQIPQMFLYCGARMCASFDFINDQIVYLPHTGFKIKHQKPSET